MAASYCGSTKGIGDIIVSGVKGIIQLPVRKWENFIETFSTTFRMHASPLNFSLIFGSTTDVGPGVMENVDRVAINMSPQSTKFLALQLTSAIEAFEDVFGTVKLPNTIPPNIEATKKLLVENFKTQNTG
jgi:hypothetical protein